MELTKKELFENLNRLLLEYEQEQFNKIKLTIKDCKGLPENAVHGGIQSVVLDEKTEKYDKPLPLIVAVGINYHQCNKYLTYPELSYYSGTEIPNIKENTGMRPVIDFALGAYQRNSCEWVKAGEAVSDIPSIVDYHLVAMNLSPFITRLKWTEHSREEQDSILEAWPWECHLDKLIKCLSNSKVDLWIWHGMSNDNINIALDTWRKNYQQHKWIFTYNLSSMCLNLFMKSAQKNPSKKRHLLYKL